jgi:FkbM family methyltransferase
MFPRRLPDDLGGCRFPASLEGGSKFLRLRSQHFDPVLTDFAKSAITEGSVVWDIGANVGLFTFVAAGLAGPTGTVVAVEADTWLVGNLRQAARWNSSAAKIIVIPVAIGDATGLGEFLVAKSARAVSYLAPALGTSLTGGIRERQTVPVLTLDCLAQTLAQPDVLKIDVEGAEALALAGAHHVLEGKPTIFIEAVERTSPLVHNLLAPHGYRYRDASTGLACAVPVFNTIATCAQTG